jgi:hypothetical protein
MLQLSWAKSKRNALGNMCLRLHRDSVADGQTFSDSRLLQGNLCIVNSSSAGDDWFREVANQPSAGESSIQDSHFNTSVRSKYRSRPGKLRRALPDAAKGSWTRGLLHSRPSRALENDSRHACNQEAPPLMIGTESMGWLAAVGSRRQGLFGSCGSSSAQYVDWGLSR